MKRIAAWALILIPVVGTVLIVLWSFVSATVDFMGRGLIGIAGWFFVMSCVLAACIFDRKEW